MSDETPPKPFIIRAKYVNSWKRTLRGEPEEWCMENGIPYDLQIWNMTLDKFDTRWVLIFNNTTDACLFFMRWASSDIIADNARPFLETGIYNFQPRE